MSSNWSIKAYWFFFAKRVNKQTMLTAHTFLLDTTRKWWRNTWVKKNCRRMHSTDCNNVWKRNTSMKLWQQTMTIKCREGVLMVIGEVRPGQFSNFNYFALLDYSCKLKTVCRKKSESIEASWGNIFQSVTRNLFPTADLPFVRKELEKINFHCVEKIISVEWSIFHMNRKKLTNHSFCGM